MRDLEWQQLETNDEEADGVVRLVLLGELDIAVTAELEAHLRQVACAGRRIRLDLSRLSFMDVCGLRAVIRSVNAARRDGWQLEIDRDVSACVRRLIDLVGAGREVWPEAAEHRRRRGRGRSQPQRAAEAAAAQQSVAATAVPSDAKEASAHRSRRRFSRSGRAARPSSVELRARATQRERRDADGRARR